MFADSRFMEKYFYLSWFLTTKKIHKSLHDLISSNEADGFLKKQLEIFSDQIEQEKKVLNEKGFKVLFFGHSDYPEAFKNLEFPPWVVTYYGNLDLLKSLKLISIVGSRRPDPEAEYWLYESVKKLSKDTVLVSGGAIGVDQTVHKAALLSGLGTVVVLPVGITKVYPKSLKPILDSYIRDQKDKLLILSQFPPRKSIVKSSFYPRNYILASLSSRLLVLQAEKKSGTMVTAKYALDMGKELYTLPATPWDNRYSGNLKLLEDGAYQLIDLNLIH
jgi:DNA processing protein